MTEAAFSDEADRVGPANSRDSDSESGPPSPYSPLLGDWRLQFAGWAQVPIGDVVQQRPAWQMTAWESDMEVCSFQAPSIPALHLRTSWRAASRACAAKARTSWLRSPPRFASFGFGEKGARQVREESTVHLFDYFEETMTAVMSAYAALEAYCNIKLVELLKGSMEVERKGKAQLMSAQEIEQHISTAQKLVDLLPRLVGCASPVGISEWPQFKLVQEIRNSVTHFKRRDISRPTAESTVLHLLIDMDPSVPPRCALGLIRHLQGDAVPRWLADPYWTDVERAHALAEQRWPESPAQRDDVNGY